MSDMVSRGGEWETIIFESRVLGTVLEACLCLISLSVYDNPVIPLAIFSFYK